MFPLMQLQQPPMPKQQIGTPNINPNQFKAWLPNLNQNMLNQLVLQARNQGIPEKEIQAGLQYINQFK